MQKFPFLVLLIPISLNLNAPIQKGHAPFVRNDVYSKVGDISRIKKMGMSPHCCQGCSQSPLQAIEHNRLHTDRSEAKSTGTQKSLKERTLHVGFFVSSSWASKLDEQSSQAVSSDPENSFLFADVH